MNARSKPGQYPSARPVVFIPAWESITEARSSSLDGLRERARAYFQRFGWPADGARILAAISGGPDSVAMLIALLLEAPEHRWEISAAHVNYRLRGAESDDDELYCRAITDRWKISLHVHVCEDSSAIPDSNRQEWARDLRYRFFDEIAAATKQDHIAVAHTVDDRAETVAAAVIDAAGTFALSGIPPVRGTIIRPLFDCRRAAIEEGLAALDIKPRLDSSNELSIYRRNHVRRVVLPNWRLENPAIVEGLARMGEQLWWQNAFLSKQASEILAAASLGGRSDGIVLDAERLTQYDSSLDPFVLRLLIKQVRSVAVPSPATVRRFQELRRTRTRGRVEQGNLVITRSKGQLMIANHDYRSVAAPTGGATLSVGVTCVYGRWRVRARAIPPVVDPNFDDSRAAYFDSRKVLMPLVLRGPVVGDNYAPVGLRGHKKLADLLADHGVPSFDRMNVPVLADSEGIIWPIGHPIADRVRITSNTKALLQVVARHHE